jgi:DNA polymerase-3 subunit epsilon
MYRYRNELPEKYYLNHFNEFIHFITQRCVHLLDKEHQEFIKYYQQLPHETQCMFVRVINRQSRYINLNKMIYQEISDCTGQLLLLEKAGFLGVLSLNDIDGWLQDLTKIQLLDILNEYEICAVKKSASKCPWFQKKKEKKNLKLLLTPTKVIYQQGKRPPSSSAWVHQSPLLELH